MTEIAKYNGMMSYLTRPPVPKTQIADLVDDLEPGSLKDELKEKYGKERKILKALVLGIGYLMGVEKLGLSLYPDKSKNYAKQKATKLREKYRRTYNKFFKGS